MRLDIGQLEFINGKLRHMVEWLETETGVEFTVTSLYRMGDDGVHGQLPLRGIDLRCRHETLGLVIEQLVNYNWQYDATRPDLRCAILHGDGANMHLHLQVHERTEKLS